MTQVEFYENKLSFEIDAWDLNAARENGENIVVLDVRQEATFNKCHIEGAVSFPHQGITAENADKFDKNTQYVTYCDGLGCNAATTGAMKLAKLGFNVRELIGGLTWWRDHSYPTVDNR